MSLFYVKTTKFVQKCEFEKSLTLTTLFECFMICIESSASTLVTYFRIHLILIDLLIDWLIYLLWKGIKNMNKIYENISSAS